MPGHEGGLDRRQKSLLLLAKAGRGARQAPLLDCTAECAGAHSVAHAEAALIHSNPRRSAATEADLGGLWHSAGRPLERGERIADRAVQIREWAHVEVGDRETRRFHQQLAERLV
jgi:hypothetical protein